jgi:hypothetical protein
MSIPNEKPRTTMSSLKATHTAHRVASDIHGTPPAAMKPILELHEASTRPLPVEIGELDQPSSVAGSRIVELPDFLCQPHEESRSWNFDLSSSARFSIAVVLFSLLMSVLVVVIASSIPAFIRGPQQTTKQAK